MPVHTHNQQECSQIIIKSYVVLEPTTLVTEKLARILSSVP